MSIAKRASFKDRSPNSAARAQMPRRPSGSLGFTVFETASRVLKSLGVGLGSTETPRIVQSDSVVSGVAVRQRSLCDVEMGTINPEMSDSVVSGVAARQQSLCDVEVGTAIREMTGHTYI